MYRIKITYDTGDSFHKETGLISYLGLTWEKKKLAQQAVKDIEDQYQCYMILNKECDAGEKELGTVKRHILKSNWYHELPSYITDYNFFGILLKNDDGKRVHQHVFWTGYFDTLVDVELVDDEYY